MALQPENEPHRLQITAGSIGRTRGHQFEKDLTQAISSGSWEDTNLKGHENTNRVIGNPPNEIIKYIAKDLGLLNINYVEAWWLGGLATSGLGDLLHMPNGEPIRRSKTDVLICIHSGNEKYVKGISVKTCNKNTPTNDQLFFTTASAFSELLRRNNIPFSNDGEIALKMFCGDSGYRPIDMGDTSKRLSDPDRWFFEELPDNGKREIQHTLQNFQRQTTQVLFQLAYPEDPHPPDYILHITVRPKSINKADMAIFTINEIIEFSCRFAGFHTKEYLIRKGRFKGDPSHHQASRFGYIQFQRGGQKQHPTQLQFNLRAGYFNSLPSDD